MLRLPITDPIKLATLEPILIRAKIDVPVITSFGVISERTSLLIRAEDTVVQSVGGRFLETFLFMAQKIENISLRTTLPHWRYLKPGNHL